MKDFTLYRKLQKDKHIYLYILPSRMLNLYVCKYEISDRAAYASPKMMSEKFTEEVSLFDPGFEGIPQFIIKEIFNKYILRS